jgi:phosphate butyryltransferase
MTHDGEFSSCRNLDFLLDRCRDGKRMRIAVVCAQDEDVLVALDEARRQGIVEGVLVGDQAKIEKIAGTVGVDSGAFEIVHEPGEAGAAERAVRMVAEGRADTLMKGLVKTATLLKAVLNKEWGLRSGALLSHLFLFYIPKMGRFYGLTDGGINTYPDLHAKVGIIENAVKCYHALGCARPRVAALAAVEVVNPDMPCTLDAAALTQMQRRGQIKGCLVDGPLALDNAVSEEAARHKGIDSDVAGKADILLVPDIEAGNLLGKTMLYLTGGDGAGVILGAKVPVVLTSRIDSARTKLLSIALGAVLSRK